MEQMINLKDLLMHEIQDLYSAEEQIIEALPAMIEKANNNELKKALQDHLDVTGKQKDRLDKVKELLGQEEAEEEKGMFSRLFGGGGHKCKGTEGIIKEGEKIMAENMTTEVRDAAIIAAAQKIEHYEICGYGTARAYARELNLGAVAELLEETLNEEYAADDLLTDLAVGKLNEEAENGRRNGRGNGSARRGGKGGNGKRQSGGSSSRGAGSKASASRSVAASRKGSKAGAKTATKSKSKAASKTASKGGSSKQASGKGSTSARPGSRGAVRAASTTRAKSPAGRSRNSRAKSR